MILLVASTKDPDIDKSHVNLVYHLLPEKCCLYHHVGYANRICIYVYYNGKQIPCDMTSCCRGIYRTVQVIKSYIPHRQDVFLCMPPADSQSEMPLYSTEHQEPHCLLLTGQKHHC